MDFSGFFLKGFQSQLSCETKSLDVALAQDSVFSPWSPLGLSSSCPLQYLRREELVMGGRISFSLFFRIQDMQKFHLQECRF